MAQPITAAGEVIPRDGLAGALGYGVIVPDGDPLDPQNRWAGPGGYVLEGLGCGPSTYTAGADFCDEARTWGPGRAFLTAGDPQHPFVVGAAVECSTFGSPAELLAEYGSRADRALEMSQWSQIANELWTGQRSDAQGWSEATRLASPAATILSASPVPLVEAIAALEDYFGGCSAGDVQLIHVPRKLSAHLDHASLIHTTPGSGRLWTANNALVIADRGYPGTSPSGDAPTPGVAWIYSTGPLSARLGPIFHPERDLGDAVAFQTNDVSVRAERLAAIAWLCCHLAIPVCY